MNKSDKGFSSADADTPTRAQPNGVAPGKDARGVWLGDPQAREAIDGMIAKMGGDPASFKGNLVREMIETSLKLIADGRGAGDLKLMRSALKELRHAYRVFARYPTSRKISIFGSARTPPDHPDYTAAVEFSHAMARAGWQAITGAGDGIMRAGHEGPGRKASFGLAIRLPFETTTNDIIEGDAKLVNFRYFFTRKLMFISQADAVAVFPGGFGTHDEAFEVLTLVQTGKSVVAPIVLIEGAGGDFWGRWSDYVRSALLGGGFISPEDLDLFYIAKNAADAASHVEHFYKVYHSSRYVGDRLVLRLQHPVKAGDVDRLAREFREIIATGGVEQCGALPEETDHPDLPRLVFHHTKHKFGVLRRMIDRINDLPFADA